MSDLLSGAMSVYIRHLWWTVCAATGISRIPGAATQRIFVIENMLLVLKHRLVQPL